MATSMDVDPLSTPALADAAPVAMLVDDAAPPQPVEVSAVLAEPPPPAAAAASELTSEIEKVVAHRLDAWQIDEYKVTWKNGRAPTWVPRAQLTTLSLQLQADQLKATWPQRAAKAAAAKEKAAAKAKAAVEQAAADAAKEAAADAEPRATPPPPVRPQVETPSTAVPAAPVPEGSMTAAEAIAAAKAEGLTLLRSPGQRQSGQTAHTTGFRGVYREQLFASKDLTEPCPIRALPYKAFITGKILGRFATAEEAALVIARTLKAEGISVAQATALTKSVGMTVAESKLSTADADQPMTAEEVHAAVEAEGLTLLPAPGGPAGGPSAVDAGGNAVPTLAVGGARPFAKSGYRWVQLSNEPRGAAQSDETRPKGSMTRPYQATINCNKEHHYLGIYRTALEAALAIARFLGPEGAASLAGSLESPSNKRTPLMTKDEVYAAAKAEGLELITAYGAAKCTTGFKCVVKADGWFRAQPTDSLLQLNPAAVRSEPDPVTGARKPLHLGRFVTAEEAALEVARALGPVGVAAALEEQRLYQSTGMTAAEALAAAEAEGLTLFKSETSSGYRAVQKNGDGEKKYRAVVVKDGEKKTLGTYNTAEEGALAVARHFKVVYPDGPPPEVIRHHRPPKPPMSLAEVYAAAKAEGLTLLRAENATGYRNVGLSNNQTLPYKVEVRHETHYKYLGNYKTPEEAALEVARFLGPDLTANRSLEPTTKYARPVLVDENGAAIQPPRDAERKSGIKIKRPGLVPKCYCGRKAAKLCGRWVCSPRQGSMCSLGRE